MPRTNALAGPSSLPDTLTPQPDLPSSSTQHVVQSPRSRPASIVEADRRSSMAASVAATLRALAPSIRSAAPEDEEYELHDLSHLRPPEHRLPDNHIETIDGGGFALSNGRLFSWNNGTASWDRLPTRDVVAVRLGADGHGYACTADNRLLRLTGSDAGRALPVPAGPVFAASPTGLIAAPATGGDGAAAIQIVRPAAGGAATVHATLPPPSTEHAVHALAYANDGRLHALTADGELWTIRPAVAPAVQGPWQPVPMPDGMSARSLYTLPKSGQVAVCDARGRNRHQLEKNGSWTPQPDGIATALQRVYGQFRSPQQKFSNVTLGSPFTPGSARSDKVGLSWWRSKLEVFSREAALQLVPGGGDVPQNGLMERYLNYFMAHYLPGPSVRDPAPQALKDQLRGEFDALAKLPQTTPPATPLDPQVDVAMHANATMALERLERAVVGLPINPHLADTDQNMLKVLLRRRESFLPAGGGAGADPGAADVTRRLRDLVNRGVHVPRPLPLHEPGRGGYAVQALHAAADTAKGLVKDSLPEVENLVAKLVSDQLCYERAIQRTTTTAADVAADLAHLDGSDGNVVSRRFKDNIWDSRAETVIGSMRSVLAGFGQENHVLTRAARMQGVLPPDKAEAYVLMVAGLEPGEGIRFDQTTQGGADGDGWSHNWTPADRFKEGAHPDVDKPEKLKGHFNIPFNIIPNILPVPSISVSHTRSMTITKRTDGVDFTFSNAYDGEVKLLCAKIKWGAGEYGANKVMTPDGKESRTALGLGFFGVELVPAALVFGKGADSSIKLSLNNDEAGTVNHVLERVLSGQITPEQLLDATAAVSYTRRQQTKWTNTLDIQGLFAAVGIFTPKLKLDERLKIVGAIVGQLTLGLNFNKESSTTQDASGITKTSTGSGALLTGNVKSIAVTEIQGSWLKALPAVSTMLGKTKDIIIGDGYEMEHKVPPWIDLQIMELFAPVSVHKAPTVFQAADGEVTKVSYNISSKGPLRFEHLPHWQELVTHSPETADNLRSAAERAQQQGLTVSVEMELIPERLALLNAARRQPADGQGGPTAYTELDDDLSRLIKNPDSWRPTRLVVAGGEQYNTALVVGASAARYRSHASNTHQANLALIDIAYDDSANEPARPLGATVRGPLTNGGARPQFDQLDTLANADVTALVYGVLDEPRDGPRRNLAALPPTGADAATLAQLAGQYLRKQDPQRPDTTPHLALSQGALAVQYFDEPQKLWRRLVLNEQQTLDMLAQPHEGVDTAALLQLMHAGASGSLRVPVGDLADLAPDGARIPATAWPKVDAGQPSDRPLSVGALIVDAGRLQTMADRGMLSPAQKHVLKTFFATVDHALDQAYDPNVPAALIHAVGKAGHEALAESAPHDTPDLDAPALTQQQQSVMVPSGTMASASA